MPLSQDIKKVLVIGSGPIVIGQAAEFDYAGTQACLALREEGIEVVLVNSNPATIMTDETVADRVYIEPLTVESLTQIIKQERPDGLIGTLGGQTGLNLTVQLHEQHIFQDYGVRLLGSSVETIQKGEDRDQFRRLMLEIGEPVPESTIVREVEEGLRFTKQIGYPVIVRPAYTLGGFGGGFASNDSELEALLQKGVRLSPIGQVLLEKSIKGWKEIEYEVMRDANDTCLTVCNMENLDPVGVHTGDSIVVAPSQTLHDIQVQKLRNASLKIIRSLGVIGGCNIQFALDPDSDRYYIIEVNPRVSRSSALASKATGYPIARMAAKCALGYHLDELTNPVTGHTTAAFEPALDYIVVKLPRFPFDKFPEAERKLGTQMQATGEVMAIDRSFEGALNKALRSLETNVQGLWKSSLTQLNVTELMEELAEGNDDRLFIIAELLRRQLSTEHNQLPTAEEQLSTVLSTIQTSCTQMIDQIHEMTGIDPWFIHKVVNIIAVEKWLGGYTWQDLPSSVLLAAKKFNLGDTYIAQCFGVKEKTVRDRIYSFGWAPVYKCVDTCAAEFEASTPYDYSTWLGEREAAQQSDEGSATVSKTVLVIGSGPIRIGQGIEFDYGSVQAAQALQQRGIRTVVINNNPETVSTDYALADQLYFEPLAAEDILHVVRKERVDGVLIQFGGQTAINVAQALAEEDVPLLGTELKAIDALEDREHFYTMLEKLDIPHMVGRTVYEPSDLLKAAREIGFPVLVRPSYVIGGQSMYIFQEESQLEEYTARLHSQRDRIWPLLVDRYVEGTECEIDVLSDGEHVLIPGIMEHIERAGVHSGDSTTVYPPLSLSKQEKNSMVDYARRIARDQKVVGLMNIQFVLQAGVVYVLEVNPRASRTVPIISKVTGVPLVRWATDLQVGVPWQEIGFEEQRTENQLSHQPIPDGLWPEVPFYSVKAPVFSNHKLLGADDCLGPEMKSTGERLGLGRTYEEALGKALFPDQPLSLSGWDGEGETETDEENADPAPSVDSGGTLLCSVKDAAKEECTGLLQEAGFGSGAIRTPLIATPGTAQYMHNAGLKVEKIDKTISAVEKIFREQKIVAVLNIHNHGREAGRFGYQLRALARRYAVPCFTSLDTFRAAVELPVQRKWQMQTMAEYRASSKESVRRST